jgi:hypothetical protein
MEFETFEHKGRTFAVRFHQDEQAGPPWEQADGHGEVRTAYLREKRPGERVLGPTGTRDVWYLYDFAGAVRIAKRDGWDAVPYGQGTKGQRAARAVADDYEFLRLWCANQWEYVGVCVSMLGAEGEETPYSASCWGVETYKNYHWDMARELAAECLSEAGHAFRAALHEAREVRYWARRDVRTAP